jgi:hypothetical protein
MSDPNREPLIEALLRTPSPTRAEQQRRAAFCYSVALGWVLLVFTVASSAAHSLPRPWLRTALIAVGLCGVGALGSALAFARGRAAVGGRRAWLALATLLSPLAVFSWLTVMRPADPGPEVPAGWRCLGLTIAIGAALLIAFAVAKRGSQPVHPNWLGAALGAISGVWAAVLVAAWCPLFTLAHELLGHVAPILLLAGTGALLASRSLSAAPPVRFRSVRSQASIHARAQGQR